MTQATLSQKATEYIEAFKGGLHTAGKDLDALSSVDLAPVDQFHIRGIEAIRDLISQAGIGREDHVLDLGCGLGGPARVLAATTGCTVTGFDLDRASIEAGNQLSAWTGLTDKVSLRQADATHIPEGDNRYDAAWTIHVGMFVKDRHAFYEEAARLLKPGGTFIVFDPVRRADTDYHYPLPWARTPEEDYNLTRAELEQHLVDVGFEITRSESKRQVCLEWFEAQEKAVAKRGGPPPLGLHLIVGPNFKEISQNAYRSLKEERMDIVELHAVKRLSQHRTTSPTIGGEV